MVMVKEKGKQAVMVGWRTSVPLMLFSFLFFRNVMSFVALLLSAVHMHVSVCLCVAVQSVHCTAVIWTLDFDSLSMSCLRLDYILGEWHNHCNITVLSFYISLRGCFFFFFSFF